MRTPFGIDLNHNCNLVSNFADYPLAFVDHKATQGTAFIDNLFADRRVLCRNRFVPFSAFHFSTGQDATAQAEHFLSVCGNAPIHMSLDWEESTQGIMTQDQAEEFVIKIHDETGEWPDIYGSNLVTESKAATEYNSTLANCKLWLARPRKGQGGYPRPYNLPIIDLATWKEITILQYSADASGYNQPPFASIFDGSDWNVVDSDYVAMWP